MRDRSCTCGSLWLKKSRAFQALVCSRTSRGTQTKKNPDVEEGQWGQLGAKGLEYVKVGVIDYRTKKKVKWDEMHS